MNEGIKVRLTEHGHIVRMSLDPALLAENATRRADARWLRTQAARLDAVNTTWIASDASPLDDLEMSIAQTKADHQTRFKRLPACPFCSSPASPFLALGALMVGCEACGYSLPRARWVNRHGAVTQTAEGSEGVNG